MSFWWGRARRLVDSPVLFWTIALVLAVVSGLSLTRALRPDRPADQATAVLVAQRDIAAGALLRGAVTVQAWPGTPPPDALESPPEPDAAAAADIAAGEPVLARRVGSTTGLAARLEPGMRGVWVPAPIGTIADVSHVDVIGSGDPLLGPGVSVVIARRAPVLSREPEVLLVGLTHAQSLQVVEALVNGTVTVALSGPEG
ncbi:MAG: hypothetical protein ACERLM_02355 [Acidimicrobiales bacterium]